ncbi:MAG TPA: MFS transporter [Bacteroidia bacterium]|nr:MFS transporter [Bacteroidia bacterium]
MTRIDPKLRRQILLIILVAGMGYFVDIYDLILFLFVKKSSLAELNIPETEYRSLLNYQMVGMLLGGIVWGILGDKKGRLSTLFFTILIYSLANIANGFVQDLEQYRILRFIAGFGLAGELGIGITLVSEIMSKESRGYGTAIVAGIGIAGAALGYFVTHYYGWRMAFWTGGGLGLALLVLRVSIHESTMFAAAKKSELKRGNFLELFTSRAKLKKYLFCILIGVPVWYVIGIIIAGSEKFALNVFHIDGTEGVKDIGAKSVFYHYIGASIGSFITGFMSQWLRSRKKALILSLIGLVVILAAFFCSYGVSLSTYYFVIFLLGIVQGYWAIFVTISSEQFGTNLRATVATSVPNIVRGATVLMTLSYASLGTAEEGSTKGAIIVGAVVMALAFWAAFSLKETYGKELDYLEPAE